MVWKPRGLGPAELPTYSATALPLPAVDFGPLPSQQGPNPIEIAALPGDSVDVANQPLDALMSEQADESVGTTEPLMSDTELGRDPYAMPDRPELQDERALRNPNDTWAEAALALGDGMSDLVRRGRMSKGALRAGQDVKHSDAAGQFRAGQEKSRLEQAAGKKAENARMLQQWQLDRQGVADRKAQDMADPTSQLSKSRQAAFAPYLERLGISPETLAAIPASELTDLQQAAKFALDIQRSDAATAKADERYAAEQEENARRFEVTQGNQDRAFGLQEQQFAEQKRANRAAEARARAAQNVQLAKLRAEQAKAQALAQQYGEAFTYDPSTASDPREGQQIAQRIRQQAGVLAGQGDHTGAKALMDRADAVGRASTPARVGSTQFRPSVNLPKDVWAKDVERIKGTDKLLSTARRLEQQLGRVGTMERLISGVYTTEDVAGLAPLLTDLAVNYSIANGQGAMGDAERAQVQQATLADPLGVLENLIGGNSRETLRTFMNNVEQGTVNYLSSAGGWSVMQPADDPAKRDSIDALRQQMSQFLNN